MTFYSWIKKREAGLRPEYGGYDSIYKVLYNTITPFHGFVTPQEPCGRSEYGGVFNLEFNIDG